MTKDCTPNNFVDVFWGSKAFSRQSNGFLSKKWFFYKPQTGNLSPACHLPNSAFSVVPYSGGYPTGYGIYNPSYSAVPTTFANQNRIKGFTHFCHSGTGFINYFYNYFMICPSDYSQSILSEKGGPGWYEVETPAYRAEIALDGKTANYHFELKNDNSLTILPYYGGLDNDSKRCNVFHFPYTIKELSDALVFCVNADGINIYFAVASKSKHTFTRTNDDYKLTFDATDFTLSVGYSLSSEEEAYERVASSSFDYTQAKHIAESIWNDTLSVVDIVSDERTKTLFYTALYNANKKPCIDNYVFPVFDIATLWDMYKTQMPLTFMLYPQKATQIVNGLSNCFSDGYFRNGKLMTPTLSKSMQAVCLMSITIATAYLLGIDADYYTLMPLAKKDVEYHARRAKFFKPYLTHNLDLLDAYYALLSCGVSFDEDVQATIRYREKHLCGKNTLLKHGLLYKYYEGTYKNYSFRVSSSSPARLSKCDRKALSQNLDSFFGFVGNDVPVYTTPTNLKVVSRCGKRYNRFEGLNNQPDMETMYMYHLLGEYDKCEDIINELISHNFNLTQGGIPGNDDSGGLTSWLALNILGLFPVAGTGKILLGSPQVESATIKLKGKLEIKTVDKATDKYVKRVLFNGRELVYRQIDFITLNNGGELLFEYGRKYKSVSDNSNR